MIGRNQRVMRGLSASQRRSFRAQGLLINPRNGGGGGAGGSGGGSSEPE